MSASVQYLSVGCNRTPHCLDWAGDSQRLVAYGADKSIALAQESTDGCGPDEVVAMLHGHTDRVNCVQWVGPRSGSARYTAEQRGCVELASGSVDKNVIIWQRPHGLTSSPLFEVGQLLSGHTGAVNCVATINLISDEESPIITTLIASGSADSAVLIWERPSIEAQFSLLQTISFGRGFIIGLDFHELPGVKGQPLLACGGDDAKIHLFTRGQNKEFSRIMSLTGHEDWIRDVSFTQEDSGDLLLASCSQDAYIRLWRIAMETTAIDPAVDELKLTSNVFSIFEGDKFKVTVESVLIGHEDWVYSVQWQPLQLTPTHTQPLCLLSVSMDKTMLLWRPDPFSGVWEECVRVGDVGGNTLGLYGGQFSPHGNMIIGHGYQGAFHLWKNSIDQSDEALSVTDQSEKWIPLPTMSGHFEAVEDISWEPGAGEYLVSVSNDQTCRLHAPWRKKGKSPEEIEKTQWREIARPQIHGYDMRCVTMVDPLLYVSGSDEKVLRVFRAPLNFIGNLHRIAGVDLTKGFADLPVGASVPSLGLSNKAVFDSQRSTTDKPANGDMAKNAFGDNLPVFSPVDLEAPPVEAHLLQNTLWPETQKLYGHGYELYCIASCPNSKYIASACKASKAEHASIHVWSTSSWRQVATLTLHTLTVTQLTFSHSGERLLAVSRDRGWSLWKLNNSNDGSSLEVCMEAHIDRRVHGHSRIIWGCGWSCDDTCFGTASRDKKVIVWSCDSCVESVDCGGGWRRGSPPLECSSAATALDFAPVKTIDKRHIIAVGLEDGTITLHTCPTPSHTAHSTDFWSPLLTLSPAHCHTSTVKCLCWRPFKITDNEQEVNKMMYLASCSTDHCVKIFTIFLNEC